MKVIHMLLNEALDFLDSIGIEVVETNQYEKDIYDIQDYVLHHAKYEGIYQMQIIIDWLSPDNANEDCFIRWIQTNYKPDCDFRDLCDKCIIAAEEHLNRIIGKGTQEVMFENPMYDNM